MKTVSNRSLAARFILVWLLSFGLEVPLVLFLLPFPNPFSGLRLLPVWLLSHVFGALVMLFCVPRGLGLLSYSRLWGRTLAVWTLFFPGFGLLVAGLFRLALGQGGSGIFAQDDGEEINLAAQVRSIPVQSHEVVAARVRSDLDVMPLSEVMIGTDLGLIRGAVERLAEIRTPEAIAILLAHRGSGLSEVRFFATTALTRIKNEFDEELTGAKREMRKDVYKVSARFFLAKVYVTYARSGLLDAKTTEAYVHEALHHLDIVRKSEFAAAAALWFLIELLMEREEWQQALAVLDEVSSRPDRDTSKVSSVRIFIHYHTGDFKRMREEMASLPGDGVDPRFQALLNWWGVRT